MSRMKCAPSEKGHGRLQRAVILKKSERILCYPCYPFIVPVIATVKAGQNYAQRHLVYFSPQSPSRTIVGLV